MGMWWLKKLHKATAHIRTTYKDIWIQVVSPGLILQISTNLQIVVTFILKVLPNILTRIYPIVPWVPQPRKPCSQNCKRIAVRLEMARHKWEVCYMYGWATKVTCIGSWSLQPRRRFGHIDTCWSRDMCWNSILTEGSFWQNKWK